MSASRQSPLLATVVALGLIVATTIVIYSKSSKEAASQRERSARGLDTTNPIAHKQRSEMETEEARTAPPLSLEPAPAGCKALVVCLEGSEEASVAQQWAGRSRGAGANVSACPPSFLGSLLSKADHAGAYDSIVVETEGTAGKGVEGAVLGQVLKLLKAGGKVHVASPTSLQGSSGDDAGATADAAAATKRALTFAGFLRVAPCSEDDRVLSGERAAWDTGASAPVRLSFSKPSVAAAVSNGSGSTAAAAAARNDHQNGNGSAASSKTWKLALDDEEDDEGSGGRGVFGSGGGDEDDDLVDEDALLESSAPVKRASEADGDGGCATKRRACKDCSCGRAEMEMSGSAPLPLKAVSVGNVDDVVTSACGNCSKGDAFRCAGCPFLGKPAFEKGQEKTIMLADLDEQQDD